MTAAPVRRTVQAVTLVCLFLAGAAPAAAQSWGIFEVRNHTPR